jgi:hypothetical protein
VQETVLQAEMLTHVYMNPELRMERVETCADELLNSWLRLRDAEVRVRSVATYKELLVREFEGKAIALLREHRPLLGTWAKVRRAAAAVAKMAAASPPKFGLSKRLDLLF